MPNALGKIVVILFSVLLFFILPILYLSQKQDVINQNYVMTETVKFVDSIKNQGYLTKNMYDSYIKKIDETNNVYTVEIEHSHKTISPLYDEDSKQFLDDISTNYYSTYEEDILKELYEGSGTYTFSQGDYISVKVYNKNKTFSAKLQQSLYHSEMPGIQILITYGGIIRDEDY